jgi:NAD(P)H-hydrate epimerase
MVAMQVLSAVEMQLCDRLTTERFGIPSIELMREASAAVASFAQKQFPDARRITVLCGRGNNGGDGLMTARLLAQAGLEVTTLLLGAPEALTGDAQTAWNELLEATEESTEKPVHIIYEAQDLEQHTDALQADLIVDAVLGTGFKPPMRGMALAVLHWMQFCTAPVLAVDLPSGWPADETVAHFEEPVFRCDAAITFTSPKAAHVFGQLTRCWNQPIVVVPIGSPDEAIEDAILEAGKTSAATETSRVLWSGAAIELVQAQRAVAANKGNFGHVLVVGGCFGSAGGKAGAPAMASLAALRAGAGLVTAAVPAPALAVVASAAPELMTWPLAANAAGQIGAGNLAPETLSELVAGKTVLAIGPGLGQAPETARFLAELLIATKIPAVLDADALNLLAANPSLLEKLRGMTHAGRTIVLTPHPGEMARLAGISVAEVQKNRLEVARNFAQQFGVILVLKGARTLIAHPDGDVAVNTSGNPGMAKGGSGDVLTGVIAGLLAQHPAKPTQAVEAAVYLHGLAADLAVQDADEHTVLATDSLAYLSRAFRFHYRGANDYLWLQGGLPQTASTEVHA